MHDHEVSWGQQMVYSSETDNKLCVRRDGRDGVLRGEVRDI